MDSKEFIQSHLHDDPLQLLLQQGRYPDVDMRWVVQQIEGRRQAVEKWPSLCLCEDYLYPPKINREQSSSEAAARYKSSLIPEGCVLADLTGGMGVDSYFFSLRASQVDYYELNPELESLSRENFKALGANNVCCHCEDGMQNIIPHDIIFVDPARRDENGRKVKAFESCEPNILEHLDDLKRQSGKLIIKASPMIDIHMANQQLGGCESIHIVSVKGECKEILFVVGKDVKTSVFHCIDIHSERTYRDSFTLEQEQQTEMRLCEGLKNYIYEPHASLMKGGAYKSICRWYDVEKLDRNTHIYTSNRLVENFPGRVFEVMQQVSLNAKDLGKLLPDHKAHLLARNHPMNTSQLQKKLRIIEGGTLHIIATTLRSKPIGILCRSVKSGLF